jgi:hypothetical protein
MKIGVDFDRVLFDTEEFKQYLEDEIPGFLDTYGLATGQGYNPEKHAEIMSIDPDTIYDTLDYSEGRFLYEDVGELQSWTEEHEVVIISRGDPEFQSTKIENADLGFEYFIVTGEAQLNPKQLGEDTQHPEEDPVDFLVDDRPYEHRNFDGPGTYLQRPDESLEDVMNENLEPVNSQPGGLS